LPPASIEIHLSVAIGARREGESLSIPNQITLGRLLLAMIFFGVLSFYVVGDAERDWVLDVAFWLFLAASLGDWLDGYLARKLKQITVFGRVVDPVVDKMMVCGAFIFFSSTVFVDSQGENVTGVAPWMAVVVLLRELFVSAIRAFSESQGIDFAASWIGKIKMTVQAATVCIVLGVLAWYEESLQWLRVTAVWATVIVTALSIITYMQRAYGVLFSPAAMSAIQKDR
jgi:CDP-diacylglycerol--glycerol-3-phosphate 3-phosphatidyltransferase